MHGEQGDRSPERAGEQAEQQALDAREEEQVAPAGAARAQQREVAAVALDRSERGEVREPERDERAGHGEHDVERLRVQRVAGRAGERCRRGCRRTRPVPGSERSTRLRICVACLSAADGLPGSAAGSTCACTCHWMPLCVPGTAGLAFVISGSAGATFAANVSSGRIAMFAGGCAGAGPT